jgi:hypothetical protein
MTKRVEQILASDQIEKLAEARRQSEKYATRAVIETIPGKYFSCTQQTR